MRHTTIPLVRSQYCPPCTVLGAEGVIIVMRDRRRMTIELSHPYNPGTDHVGCSPVRHTLLAACVKRREVLSKLHEELAAC